MNKICKFNHEGDCCNSGSIHFPNKCIGQCGAFVPLTQYERIKQMSVEEMAEKLAENTACGFCKLLTDATCDNTPCRQGIIQYFESEVEEK